MNTLRITNDTSLRQLQSFMEGKGDNTRVLGTKDSEGIITLYLKPEARTAVGRFFQNLGEKLGIGSTRVDNAREAIQGILARTADAVGDNNDYLGKLMRNVHDNHAVGHRYDANYAQRTGTFGKVLDLLTTLTEKTSQPPTVPRSKDEIQEDSLKSIGLGKDNVTNYIGGDRIKSRNGLTEVGPIKIGDTVYKPIKHLADGGFAAVFHYQSEDGKHDIAFKVTLPNPVSIPGAVKEIKVHQHLSEKSPDGVVKMLGAMRLPGDKIGIATEFAPFGDVESMAEKISERIAPNEDDIQPGQITKGEARVLMLTMLKDMATGLASMHENAKATHFDFKPANALIMSDGTAKISDFGTSTLDKKLFLQNVTVPDAPTYVAPELCYLKTVGEKQTKMEGEIAANIVLLEKQQLRRDLANLFGISSSNEEKMGLVDDYVSNILENREKIVSDNLNQANADLKPMVRQPQKADIWGFGSSALQLLTGKAVMRGETGALGKFMFAQEKRLTDLYSSSEPSVQPRGENGQLAGKSVVSSTGDKQIDDLMSWILSPRPEDRPTAKQILEHPIFSSPGVGSIEAHDLIRYLGSHGDTPEIINVARLNLRDEMIL